MLDQGEQTTIADAADLPASLVVIVDTEEEFDWSKPLSRGNVSVESVRGQTAAHEVFDRYGVVPTYVVDYPVACTPSAAGILRELRESGRCLVGAHLHPWVNPPHVEAVNPRNSYPGNLPAEIEYEKLARLTETIETNFAVRPIVYRAGRFGFGPSTGAALERLGYRVDTSIVPATSFAADGGPDFTSFGFAPFRFGSRGDLLELPQSCGFCGLLQAAGPELYPRLFKDPLATVHAPGILARLRLLERIRLTPEGIDLAAQKRLVRALLKQGCRVFTYTYHSPSLVPGNTPYVRTDHDLKAFLQRMDAFFEWFIDECGGKPTTPIEIYERLGANRASTRKDVRSSTECSAG
jgi:hypothetical protein